MTNIHWSCSVLSDESQRRRKVKVTSLMILAWVELSVLTDRMCFYFEALGEAFAGGLTAVTVRRVGVDGSPRGPEEVLSRSRRSVRLDDRWAETFLHGVSAGEAEVVSAAPQTKLSVQEAAQTNIRSVLPRCFCCWARSCVSLNRV